MNGQRNCSPASSGIIIRSSDCTSETNYGFPVVSIIENKRKKGARRAKNFPAAILTAAPGELRNANKKNFDSTPPEVGGFGKKIFIALHNSLGLLLPKSPQWKIIPHGSLGMEGGDDTLVLLHQSEMQRTAYVSRCADVCI